jgi:Na+-translocating ferredoxin:NAD+ oxidoreductase RNF subunit RnfB
MGSANLTTASQIQCPHGGQATLTTSNVNAKAGAAMLLETDIHIVAGCSFCIGPNPSPCMQIQWSAGATKVKAGGTAVLTSSSVGKCYSAANVPQGVATVANTQSQVKST